MTRISRFKLTDHTLQKLFDLFFEVISKQKTKDSFRKTINDLLSPVERIVIAKRIAITYLLLQEIDYQTICMVLKVSPGTVAKFSILREKSEGIVPTFKVMLRNEKIALFLMEIFNTLYPPGTPGINWGAAWKRKMVVERKKIRGGF